MVEVSATAVTQDGPADRERRLEAIAGPYLNTIPAACEVAYPGDVQLEDRLEAMSRLAAAIAHEFSNHLLAINSFAESARRAAANSCRLQDGCFRPRSCRRALRSRTCKKTVPVRYRDLRVLS